MHAQSCLTLCNPMDCSSPGSSVLGIFQAIILEWIAIPLSRGSSQLRDWIHISCVGRQILTTKTPRKSHIGWSVQFSSVQSLSHVQLFAMPWIAAHQASLSITSSWSLLKLMPIELVMPSRHLILCCPLLLLPPVPPSIRVFSNESTLHMRWPKYWSFSFSISPSNEHPGLISFRMDWLDLLAVQGTLKSSPTPQFKALILKCSAFFTVQHSHPYRTTGKTIALTRWTFVGKVMSLLFNMLSRLVKTFLPMSKCLNFMAAVTICSILEPPKIKSDTVSTVSPSISHEVMGPDAMILVFWMLRATKTFHSVLLLLILEVSKTRCDLPGFLDW